MKFSFLFLLLFVVNTARSQINVESFTATQTGIEVKLDWVIGPGNTCADLEIQHSTDSITFTTVFVYPGICGDATFSQSYSWTHAGPMCGTKNYYRVVSMSGGTLSERSINVLCYGEAGILVSYDRISGALTVNTEVPVGQSWDISFFDLNGALIAVEKLNGNSTNFYWESTHSGMFIYEVKTTDGTLRNGRVLIRK
ncbi:MAG TPA: hypothetical protein VK826_16765 [Bacteroidia bacterium]|nr:hypothetical protein [Bacteroidia bacterium]